MNSFWNRCSQAFIPHNIQRSSSCNSPQDVLHNWLIMTRSGLTFSLWPPLVSSSFSCGIIAAAAKECLSTTYWTLSVCVSVCEVEKWTEGRTALMSGRPLAHWTLCGGLPLMKSSDSSPWVGPSATRGQKVKYIHTFLCLPHWGN